MKRCVTAIDLSEHYQEVHTEHEARGQELLSDSSVTVGPCILFDTLVLGFSVSLCSPALVLVPFYAIRDADGFSHACLRRISKEEALGSSAWFLLLFPALFL